jgi:L-lactate permease
MSTSLIHDFNAYDEAGVTSMTSSLVDLLNVNSLGQIGTPNADAIVNTKTYPGYTFDVQTQINKTMQSVEYAYALQVNDMLVQNKIVNLSSFVDESYGQENKRVRNILKKTSNDLLKMRQSFLNLRYDVFKTNYYSTLVQVTICVSIIIAILFLMTKWKRNGANPVLTLMNVLVIGAFVLSIYILVMVMIYSNSRQRRKDDWTKYNFDKEPKM